MSGDGQKWEKKSLRVVSGEKTDWKSLAKHCVAFANSAGGTIAVGIENGEYSPPDGKIIPEDLVDEIQKKMGDLTVNVSVQPKVSVSNNKARYIEIQVSRSLSVASTTDGKFYIRVGDTSRPLKGSDITCVLTDKPSFSWETRVDLGIDLSMVDPKKVDPLVKSLKASGRVKNSVKQKTPDQLLDHYSMTQEGLLTNLGILCVGNRSARAELGTAPIVQFIKYNHEGRKTNKICWDDHTLSPIELVTTIWKQIPDFRENDEIPNGMRRRQIPAFDKEVVRELLVNAFVHRPYTQQGGIDIKLHPDRLEITNPGRLPVGVTPRNALHATVRRNERFARLFHDLNLMEREGSGIDRMYEVLLSHGRTPPEIKEDEDTDSVTVVVKRDPPKPRMVDIISKVNAWLSLEQREGIALGLLARENEISALGICDFLKIDEPDEIESWLHRLIETNIVKRVGTGQTAKYLVDAERVAALNVDEMNFDGTRANQKGAISWNLRLIEKYVYENPGCRIGSIHEHMGPDISRSRLKRWSAELVESGKLISEGVKRGTRYRIADPGTDDVDGMRENQKDAIPGALMMLIEKYVYENPGCRIGDIHEHMGLDIPRSQIKRRISELVESGKLISEGVKRGTCYRIADAELDLFGDNDSKG